MIPIMQMINAQRSKTNNAQSGLENISEHDH